MRPTGRQKADTPQKLYLKTAKKVFLIISKKLIYDLFFLNVKPIFNCQERLQTKYDIRKFRKNILLTQWVRKPEKMKKRA